MLSVIRSYLSDMKLLLEEALFVVFGDVIYDIGVKRIVIVFALVVLAVAAVFAFMYLRRRLAARVGKLDRIAAAVEENSLMLRRLLAEKATGPRDDGPQPGG